MKELIIKGYLQTSLIDWEGKIVSLVFLPRCNFRCPFCHNADLVSDDPSLEIISPEVIFNNLKSQKKWIDGVCITGGEPTLHKALPEFISKIKELGFLVKLDTNGTNPKILEALIKKKLLDYVAMDIKGPLDKYDEIVGVKVNKEAIQKSIDILRSSDIDYEFRTTVVPTFLKKEDFIKIAKWLKGSKRYYLQQFVPQNTLDRKFLRVRPYTPDTIMEFWELIKDNFEVCAVRGM